MVPPLTLPHTFTDSNIITDQQLMKVASQIGDAWDAIGLELGIQGFELEQLQLDNPTNHRRKVHKMLKLWRGKQEQNMKTAAHLYAKLTELEIDLDIEFLVDM